MLQPRAHARAHLLRVSEADPLKRVLFLAEGITLAQMVRLRMLAAALDTARYEVHFACSAFPPLVFENTCFRRWTLRTVDPARALHAAERGRTVYDRHTLAEYVTDELRLFDQVAPDLVVGDFRLSLAISAPVSHVRFAALINAYWSPHADRPAFPLPEHPMVEWLGEALAARFFPYAMPAAFAAYAAPVNALRRRYGLSPIGSLLEVLTFGDDVLFPDIPEVAKVKVLLPGQRYLGALCWSPELPLPSTWSDAQRGDRKGPRVYVTLGSSGRAELLPLVLEALAGLGAQVLVATAARHSFGALPAGVTALAFVAGDRAARVSDLVIGNGGSSTGYQALAAGTPVLGLPSNLDQTLAMTAIEEAGAGILVRSGKATASALRTVVQRLLASADHHARAQELARHFARADALATFRAYVDEVLADTGARPEVIRTRPPRQSHTSTKTRRL